MAGFCLVQFLLVLHVKAPPSDKNKYYKLKRPMNTKLTRISNDKEVFVVEPNDN